MRLFEAPAIVGHRHVPGCTLLARAADKIRAEFDTAPADNTLKKPAQDIWALKGPLGPHTDKTKAGYFVFGVVIINEGGLVLYRDQVVYDLPVGAIYALNGRRVHAALAHNKVDPEAMFAFLAWDCDRNTPLQELIDSWPESLEAWVNGEERVNIA